MTSLESAWRCRDGRCGTLLPRDAELCDECGGADLVPANQAAALLLGFAAERPVAFDLKGFGPTVVGRGSSSSEAPDISLARLPDSNSVHRRHAALEVRDGAWQITHLGTNPLVVQREQDTLVVEPGSTVALRPDDWLQFGRVRLRLVVPTGGSAFDVQRRQ